MNQNDNTEEARAEETHTFKLTSKEVEVLFKYLSRAELKGIEVPEFNNLLNLFKINNV